MPNEKKPNDPEYSPEQSEEVQKRRLEVAKLYFRDYPPEAIAEQLGCSVSTVRRDIRASNLERIKRDRIDGRELRKIVSEVLAEKDEADELRNCGLQYDPVTDRYFHDVELVLPPNPNRKHWGVFPPVKRPDVELIKEDLAAGRIIHRYYTAGEEVRRRFRKRPAA